MSILDRRNFAAGLGVLALGTMEGSAEAQYVPRDPLAGRFGGPFSLTNHEGRKVTDRDFRGQYLVVYFGFTRCTDACPIDVPNIVAALDKLGSLAERVTPLFITVDPEDTPEKMAEYVRIFHPRLVGLTGSEAELSAVARAYRVHRYRVQRQAAAGPRHMVRTPDVTQHVHGDKPHTPGQTFTIDHGTLTYVMGPDGGFLSLIPRNSGADRIAAVLRNHIKS